MNSKIFLGGINYKTTEKELLEVLSEYGEVVSIRVVTDTETGRSRGFAFATFVEEEGAKKAIEALDNSVLHEKRIGVKEAFERKPS